MDDTLEWRIRTFFGYWRRRLAFIRALDLAEHSHEANILVWAALDALANLWARSLGKGTASPARLRETFDMFLARYGGDPFQRISLPDVWHRAERETKSALSAHVLAFLGAAGGRRKATFLEQRQARRVEEDPELSWVQTPLCTSVEA